MLVALPHGAGHLLHQLEVRRLGRIAERVGHDEVVAVALTSNRTSNASTWSTGPHVIPSRSLRCSFATSMSGTTMPTWYSLPTIAMFGAYGVRP